MLRSRVGRNRDFVIKSVKSVSVNTRAMAGL
jgi:hypothetical protein